MVRQKKLQAYSSPSFLAYALIAPAAIYILCIVAWPLIETFRLSFTNSSLAGEDYIGTHSDDEKQMGKNSTVAALTLTNNIRIN